ncbi:hypothetical protein [Streptomyces sp. CMB-StM0423]|uniref:hypothetical protein n=1 Tax=Streptomyces sp. CMB-StM0423 TaxID=2059884 RepID=UPI000C70407D|nr:hypothetical protein [Streptomyces sp. CMB-StM0423]AUH41345.1 hypothetical protein CXR04_14815 [Streptomyces sp. CMB-StM0423]
MFEEFGSPPLAEENRAMVAERLKQAKAEEGAKVTVTFRGEQRYLHVIAMPVEMLYFNPDTHRVRAQRSLDSERSRTLDGRPWSDEAQEYLHYLLTRQPSNPAQTDPEYIELREELEDYGQRESGIITPDGILVDGNTRCAALRELGVKDIRVGVLPADTVYRDINDVEMSLQLRHDKRRDYSYINQLIAIEDELARSRREEDVARDFNIKLKTLRTDRRVYQMILEAIDRSVTAGGVKLRLVDFEGHQEKLRELQRDYVTCAETNADAAEMLKESRLAMVVLNYPKTSLRLAEADFHSDFLAPRLPDELRPGTAEAADKAIPGLPGVVLPAEPEPVRAVKALTDTLLQAKAAQQADGQLEPPLVAAANEKITKARETFDVAVRMAGLNAQLKKRRAAVPDRLTDAAEHVSQCVLEFADARAKRVLDEDSFDDGLIALRDSLARLARLAGRTFDSPGDGVAWLLDATRGK